MNNVILRGRLTADAEVKISNGEKSTTVARFSLAVPDRTSRSSNGEQETDFIKTVSYGPLAENVQKYTSKGSEVLISGRLHTYSYMNNNRKVYMTEVVAEHVEFLSKCSTADDAPANNNRRSSK